MRRKKIDLGVLTFILCFALIWTQSDRGGPAARVDIRLEKEVVRPGETMEITLTNFTDAKGARASIGSPLVVYAFQGKLEGGMVYDGFAQLEGQKGRLCYPNRDIKLLYTAADDCKFRTDTISVYNTEGAKDDTSVYLVRDRIAKKEIVLICPVSAIITYRDYYHTKSGKESTTKDINLKLLVNFKNTKKKPTNHLAIESLKVISYYGIDNYVYGTTKEENKLISVTPSTRGYFVQCQTSKDNKKIIAVNFPLIMMNLKWQGTDSFVSPDHVSVGPVSEKKEMSEREENKVKSELEKTMGDKWSSKSDKIEGLNLLFGMTGHPDFQVTEGDGIHSAKGGGELRKLVTDGNEIKVFKWEILLK